MEEAFFVSCERLSSVMAIAYTGSNKRSTVLEILCIYCSFENAARHLTWSVAVKLRHADRQHAPGVAHCRRCGRHGKRG